MLEETPVEPVSCDNIETVQELAMNLEQTTHKSRYAKELQDIFTNPHFKVSSEHHIDSAFPAICAITLLHISGLNSLNLSISRWSAVAANCLYYCNPNGPYLIRWINRSQ